MIYQLQLKQIMLLAGVMVLAIGLFAWSEMQKRAAMQKLAVIEHRLEGIDNQGEDAAQEVLRQVRQMYDLSKDLKPAVVMIVDVESLRQEDAFYNRAKNGDYVIVTHERAILYDPDRNIIVDVVPILLEGAETVMSMPDEG